MGVLEVIVGGIVAAVVTALTHGLFKTVHDAIWWNGAIKGGLFVGLVLVGVYLLGRRDK